MTSFLSRPPLHVTWAPTLRLRPSWTQARGRERRALGRSQARARPLHPVCGEGRDDSLEVALGAQHRGTLFSEVAARVSPGGNSVTMILLRSCPEPSCPTSGDSVSPLMTARKQFCCLHQGTWVQVVTLSATRKGRNVAWVGPQANELSKILSPAVLQESATQLWN